MPTQSTLSSGTLQRPLDFFSLDTNLTKVPFRSVTLKGCAPSNTSAKLRLHPASNGGELPMAGCCIVQEGVVLGSIVGLGLGLLLGFLEGTGDGATEGSFDGLEEGSDVGGLDGNLLGFSEGLFVGWSDGAAEGIELGTSLGAKVGDVVGRVTQGSQLT